MIYANGELRQINNLILRLLPISLLHGRRDIRCAGIDEIIDRLLELVDASLGDLVVLHTVLGLILGKDVAEGPNKYGYCRYMAETE